MIVLYSGDTTDFDNNGVFALEHFRESSIEGGSIGYLGYHDGKGKPAGEQGNDDSDIHNISAPGTVNGTLQQGRSRGIGKGGKAVLSHISERQHGEQKVDGKTSEESENGCFADIGLTSGSAGNDNGTFNTDKSPEGDKHGGLDLSEHGAEGNNLFGGDMGFTEHVKRKGTPAEHKEHDKNKQCYRQKFAYSSYRIDKGSLTDSAQNGKIHKPDHDGTADDGPEIVSPGKISRKKVIKSIHQQNRIADIAEDIAKPVRPCHLESGKPTEPEPGIGVDTGSGIGTDNGKYPESIGKKKDTDSGNDPCGNNSCN